MRQDASDTYNSRRPSLVLALLLFVTNQAATPPPVDAGSRGRAVLAALSTKQFAAIEAQSSGEWKAALPPGRLETVWTMLSVQFGAHKGCSSTSRVVEIAGKQMVIGGAIVFAGAARSLDAPIVERLRYVAMLDGTISPEEQKQIDAAVQEYDTPSHAAEEVVRDIAAWILGG